MRQQKHNTKKPAESLKSAIVRLTPERHRWVKAQAANRGLTIQQVLEAGLELALAQADRNKN